MIDFELLFLVTLKKHLMLIFRLQYKRVVVKREELLVHPPQKSTCLKKIKTTCCQKGKRKNKNSWFWRCRASLKIWFSRREWGETFLIYSNYYESLFMKPVKKTFRTYKTAAKISFGSFCPHFYEKAQCSARLRQKVTSRLLPNISHWFFNYKRSIVRIFNKEEGGMFNVYGFEFAKIESAGNSWEKH